LLVKLLQQLRQHQPLHRHTCTLCIHSHRLGGTAPSQLGLPTKRICSTTDCSSWRTSTAVMVDMYAPQPSSGTGVLPAIHISAHHVVPIQALRFQHTSYLSLVCVPTHH
jgi:hypothetical protein